MVLQKKRLKCFIEITSQLLCVLLLLTTEPINLGETSFFFFLKVLETVHTDTNILSIDSE